jgi:hypothetical protein
METPHEATAYRQDPETCTHLHNPERDVRGRLTSWWVCNFCGHREQMYGGFVERS